ncbi:MAG: MbcA/ParS/Xre antitoxin family protein [Pseudomonadota bacterium]|nr:MbcA/ParS/Xre antitoxin family protein [Pseudomonadota bacterium]
MLSRFLAKAADPKGGGLSPSRVGGALKMSVADLSRVTRLHRNTITRTPGSPSVQARVGEIARIVTAAAEIVGDDAKAAVWFRHQPLMGFGGQTAEELVSAGHADAVLNHLDTLTDGGYA